MNSKKNIAVMLAAFSILVVVPQTAEAATTPSAAQQRYYQQQRAIQQKQIREQNFQNQLYNYYQRGINAYQAKNYSTAVNYLSRVVQ